MSNQTHIKASVQYNDIVGTLAADFNDLLVFNDFISKTDFDSQNYFIYSYSFEFGEPKPNKKRSTKLIIHAIEKNIVGNSMKDIIEYAESNNNQIPSNLFYVDLPQDDFFNLFKRFKVTFNFNLNKGHYLDDCFTEDILNEEFL